VKTILKPSQIAMLAGGVIVFLFSFFNFVSSPIGDDGFNGWSGDYLFPLSAFPALFALIVAGTTAAVLFGNVSLPEPIVSFNWRQLNFILAFTALVILVGLLLSTPEGVDLGIGLIISLLGGIAMLGGAVMELLGINVGGAASTGGSTQAPGGPSTSF